MRVSKTPETLDLEARLLRYTSGQFGCDEVTIGSYGRERVDYLSLDWRGTWRCFEIKASKSDFRSKARKTFVGHLNYYVMPDALYEAIKDEIPEHIGVLVAAGPGLCLVSRKKAVRQPLGADERKLSASLIRSLYRTYEQVKLSGSETAMQTYKQRIAQLERQRDRMLDEHHDSKRERRLMERFLRQRGLVQDYEKWIEEDD